MALFGLDPDQEQASIPIIVWLLTFLSALICTILVLSMASAHSIDLGQINGIFVCVFLFWINVLSLYKLIQSLRHFFELPGCSPRELWERFGNE